MGARIAIVAGRAELRELLGGYVRALGAGYAVVAMDGRADAARACLATAAPDIALVDLDRPGGGGLALLGCVRRRWPGAAVIALGCHEGEEYGRAALAAGAVGYLDKAALVVLLPGALRAACFPAA